jgi:hypothetical protein
LYPLPPVLELVWQAIFVIGLTLQVLVVHSLLRRESLRSYPFILLYCSTLIVTSVVERLTYGYLDADTYRNIYWIDELVVNMLLFLLVISLIFRSLGDRPMRGMLGRILATGVLLMIAYSAFLLWDPRLGKMTFRAMTVISRNLNFAAALMNLALWSLLIRQPTKDSQLLMVGAGLGIKVTGIAIAQALRAVLPESYAKDTVGFIIPLADILCLYIWWKTFRSPKPRRAVHPANGF